MTRLWTFQRNAVLPTIESSDRFLPSWESTPQNFRLAYSWMASQMYAALGVTTQAPPIWCWHSCGDRGMGPTVETARSLLSDWDIEQGLVTIELTVPESLILLSSYSRWNEFLGYVIEQKSFPPDDRQWLEMFDDQLSGQDDDTQAVIPYIRPEWIVSIRPLAIKNREPNELI